MVLKLQGMLLVVIGNRGQALDKFGLGGMQAMA